MVSVRSLAGVLAAFALVLGLAGCGGETDGEPTELAGTVIDPPFQVPDAELTDTSGQPFRLAGDTDKRLTLLFFGYSKCEDICPVVLQSLAVGLRRLDPAERDDVDVVLVTSDPARDTPEVLRSYLDRFDPSFVGLTGELSTIVETAHAVGIAMDDAERLDSGGYDPGTHGTRVIGVDGSDEAPIMWQEDTSAAEFAADVRTLLGTS